MIFIWVSILRLFFFFNYKVLDIQKIMGMNLVNTYTSPLSFKRKYSQYNWSSGSISLLICIPFPSPRGLSLLWFGCLSFPYMFAIPIHVFKLLAYIYIYIYNCCLYISDIASGLDVRPSFVTDFESCFFGYHSSPLGVGDSSIQPGLRN